MIEFIAQSGSTYRVDMSARTVECMSSAEAGSRAASMSSTSTTIEPPESAFPPRKVSDLHGPYASMGRVGRRLFGSGYTAPGEAP